MKASLKLRDDEQQRPMLRAKIPLTVAGLPFFSAVSASSSPADLQIDIGTALSSGPSVRISYRPNYPLHPFRFSLRSGTGPLGSPLSPSPISFHVDFDPLSPSATPSFSLHFKPRLGDFSLHKVTASSKGSEPGEAEGFAVVGSGSPGAAVGRALEGVELLARSVLPLRSGASVRFRWGVQFPADLRGIFADKRGAPAMPQLMMNKISVEYVGDEWKNVGKKESRKDGDREVGIVVRERLDSLKVENGMLRKAVEELRMEVIGSKTDDIVTRKVVEREVPKEKSGARVGALTGCRNERQAEKKEGTGATSVVTKDDVVNAELRKALIAATGGGA